MIPKSNDELNDGLSVFNIKIQPSKTYKVDFEQGIVLGKTDGKEAMQQAVYKILNSERFTELIYSWNYGVELSRLFGKDRDYVCSELKYRIIEALLQDDRIKKVYGFQFGGKKNVVTVKFYVDTIEGELANELEVKV